MNITIEIRNAEQAETELLSRALAHVAAYSAEHDVIAAQIEVRNRVPDCAPPWTHPGFLHYTITYRCETSGARNVHMTHWADAHVDHAEFHHEKT